MNIVNGGLRISFPAFTLNVLGKNVFRFPENVFRIRKAGGR